MTFRKPGPWLNTVKIKLVSECGEVALYILILDSFWKVGQNWEPMMDWWYEDSRLFERLDGHRSSHHSRLDGVIVGWLAGLGCQSSSFYHLVRCCDANGCHQCYPCILHEFLDCIAQNVPTRFLSSCVNLANLWIDLLWLYFDVFPGIPQSWLTAKTTTKIIEFIDNSLINHSKFADISVTTSQKVCLFPYLVSLWRLIIFICLFWFTGEEVPK